MDFIKSIDDDSILIIPTNIRDKVLEYIDSLDNIINVKIMTFNELKRGLLFDYNNEAIALVMHTYSVNYDVARNYINDLYYIDHMETNNEKVLQLKDIYKLLIDNNLLIKDKLFLQLINSKKKVYVYGFDYVSKFNMYLLDLLNKGNDLIIINKENGDYCHNVYELETIDDEIAFVAEKISDLISKGVDINKIFIANYSDEYYFTVKRVFKQYGIPYHLKNETTLYTTSIGRFFLDNLSDNLDLLLYKIRQKFDTDCNVSNGKVYNKLSSFVNNYYWCDSIVDNKDLIEAEMKNVYISTTHFVNEVKAINLTDNIFLDDEYVFLIGFNLGVIPKVKKDEDFINDAIKPSILETTSEMNQIIKKNVIDSIRRIRNLTISYKNTSSFNNYTKSYLCSLDFLNVIKTSFDYSTFSNDYNRLSLARRIDKYIKFNEYDEVLGKLYGNYTIDYAAYNNSFSGINKNNLINKINDNISFSYSNISKYYECPFKFYVSSILRINEFEISTQAFIGSLFHYCLEKCVSEDNDIIDTYEKYINDHRDEIVLKNKDKFFLELLKKEIVFVINEIRNQYQHSSHNDVWYEKHIEIEIERAIKTKIKGFVDKVLLLNNYALVIDYKTNSTVISRDLFEYGLSLQLPIYLYLLSCLDDNIKVAGLYIQHILDFNINEDPKKDYIDEKRKKLKLKGLTVNDISLISKFDDTYEKSNIIQSLSTNKTGEIKSGKSIIELNEIDELKTLVGDLIYKCIDNVADGIFDIHPIKGNDGTDGCKYCDYKDICYRKEKDFNYQNIKNNGGEDNE